MELSVEERERRVMGFCARVEGVAPGTALEVHGEDDMARLDVTAGRGEERLARYLRAGLESQRVLRGLLGACEVGRPRLLDYACGYGRVLRHFVASGLWGEIAAGDLLPEATEFVARRFGVLPVRCHRSAQEVRIPGRFHAIWVGSLFSHLGAQDTREFLGLLGRHLEVGGALVLSSHNWSLRPKQFTVLGAASGSALQPGQGQIQAAAGGGLDAALAFVPNSESRRLDPNYYGTTYTEPGALAEIARELGLELRTFAERVLWNVQDAYVFVRAGEHSVFELPRQPERLIVPRGEIKLVERTSAGLARFGGFVRLPPNFKDPLRIVVHLEDGQQHAAAFREVTEFRPSDGLLPGWRQLDYLLEGPLGDPQRPTFAVAAVLESGNGDRWGLGGALI